MTPARMTFVRVSTDSSTGGFGSRDRGHTGRSHSCRYGSRPVGDTELSFPGARRPDRRRDVDAQGSGWPCGSGAIPTRRRCSSPTAASTSPARSTGSRPLLADAGWRVVSWDQRGHGDSDHAVLYNWDADVRDALAVLDSTTRRPVPFVGHSKGGSVAAPARRRHAPPVQPPRQPRRAAQPAQLARRRRPRPRPAAHLRGPRRGSSTATSAGGQGARGRARSRSWPRRRQQMNPRLSHRVAALPRHDRRPPGRRRLAVEARPGAALRRLRAVAARVVDDAHARPGHARARRARARERDDGVGHPARRRDAVAAAGRAVRAARGRRPLRAHRAARARVVARARVPRLAAAGARRRLGRRRHGRPAGRRPALRRRTDRGRRGAPSGSTTLVRARPGPPRAPPPPRRRRDGSAAAAAPARPRRATPAAAARRGPMRGPGPSSGSTSSGTAPRRSRSAAATPPRSSWPTPTPRCATSARSPSPVAASAPTSPCCSPAPAPTSCAAPCSSTVPAPLARVVGTGLVDPAGRRRPRRRPARPVRRSPS